MSASGAPAWFTNALAAPVEEAVVEVEGCDIHYRTWGPEDSPGVVMVHGGAANSRWWDHIAPMLSKEYRIAAIDLSGHGDSGRRSEYGISVWAREVVRVASAAQISGPPLLVGHSMGGWVVLTVGAETDTELSGVVVIDSPLLEIPPEQQAALNRAAFGPLRVYPTADEAVLHFRPVPNQPNALPYVMDHIGRESIRPVDGGWSWKFDSSVFGMLPRKEVLSEITSRVALLRPEFGLITEEISRNMYELLGRAAPVVEIPLAGHHVMLDQPILLITCLRTLLADWEHSLP